MSAYTTRKRKIPPFGPESQFRFGNPTNRTYDKRERKVVGEVVSDNLRNVSGVQITESEGHAWPPKGHDLQDRGGPFYTRKLYIAEMSDRTFGKKAETSRLEYTLKDDILSPVGLPAFPELPGGREIPGYPDYSTSEDDLKVIGTGAIASVSPVSPLVSLPTMFGELYRDGLPTILGLKTLKGKGKPSAVGDEYLNYQFGLKPLYNDVKSLGHALITADKQLAQLKRDNGRVVRRKRYFDTEESTLAEYKMLDRTMVSVFGGQGKWWSNFTYPQLISDVDVRITTSKRKWFSGAFTYHLPTNSSEFGKLRRMAQQAERLFGLVPDGADLWNLLPWSWLGDWFVDIGPVIQNATNAQTFGQVLVYGYMMEHSITKYEYTAAGPRIIEKIGRPITLTIHDEVKQRVTASPYGFGSDWEEFTPYQLSILAALGITRGKANAR